MSYPAQQRFRPVQANVDLSGLQFSDYSNHGVQVADYSNVEYLVPSDSEDEIDNEDMEYAYTQGELLSTFLPKLFLVGGCTNFELQMDKPLGPRV